MPCLENLPPELLILVSESCDTLKDIASLALTSRHCNAVASPQLYRSAVEREDIDVAGWASRSGRLDTLQHLATAFKTEDMSTKLNVYSTASRQPGGRFSWKAGGKGRPQFEQPLPNGWLIPLRCTTPMFEAAERGDLKMVQWLIDHGSCIDLPCVTMTVSRQGSHPSKYLANNRVCIELLLCRRTWAGTFLDLISMLLTRSTKGFTSPAHHCWPQYTEENRESQSCYSSTARPFISTIDITATRLYVSPHST